MIYANPGEAGSVVSFEKRYGNYIGGEFVPPVNGQYFDNISPVNGKVFCEDIKFFSKNIFFFAWGQ